MLPTLLPASPVPLPSGLTARSLRRRTRCLRLTAEVLALCVTVGDVQALAKAQYRLLARHYHPDSMRRNTQRARAAHPHTRRGEGRPLTGMTFRLVTTAYAWIQALDPRLVLSALPPRAYVPLPCHEGELPSSFDRPLPEAPEGWHVF